MSEPRAERAATSRASRRPLRAFAARLMRLSLLILLPVALLVGGFIYYVENARYITTENAYVKAHTIAVSADITGRVVEVLVKENDLITAGQTLFRIDEEPFRIRVAQAEAEMQSVKNDIESFGAAYRQELAELNLARTDLAFYQGEYDRQRRLSERGTVSKSKHDEARHQVHTAERKMAAIKEDIAYALSRLGGDPNLSPEAHPRYLKATAQHDQALLDLARTVVRSPVDGVVGSVQLQAGEYVEEGEALFSVVANESKWITANLKETQLTHLHIGQPATLRADAYPQHVWAATVESISPATGAEFSLLPPQNASGNWVKVVQRVPVRLAISGNDDAPALRTGMSVRVQIDTERDPELPPVLAATFKWLSAITGRAVVASSKE